MQVHFICIKYVWHGMYTYIHWLYSHRLESRSERRFGSRSKTWLGSWFEIYMCVHMHCKRLPNHDQDLRTARCWPMRFIYMYAWLQRAFFKCTCAQITFRKSFAFTCPRIRLSRWITIQNNGFQKLWNSFAFTWAKIRLSYQERVESCSETSFGTWF